MPLIKQAIYNGIPLVKHWVYPSLIIKSGIKKKIILNLVGNVIVREINIT
jgi:hypothetical protein